MTYKCPVCGQEHELIDHPNLPGRVVLFHAGCAVLEMNRPRQKKKGQEPEPPPGRVAEIASEDEAE